MRINSLPFIVTSNIFLFFPMAAAAYVGEWFFFFFAFCIFVVSVGFHYTFYHNRHDFYLSRFVLKKKKYKSQRSFQVSDWALAMLGSIYVYGYIYTSPVSLNLRWVFANLFTFALLFFIYTFKIGNYNKYHPWFHVFVQTLLGFIVLML